MYIVFINEIDNDLCFIWTWFFYLLQLLPYPLFIFIHRFGKFFDFSFLFPSIFFFPPIFCPLLFFKKDLFIDEQQKVLKDEQWESWKQLPVLSTAVRLIFNYVVR